MKVIFELKDGRRIEKNFYFMNSETVSGDLTDVHAYLKPRGSESHPRDPQSKSDGFTADDIKFMEIPSRFKKPITIDQLYDELNSYF